MSESSRGVARRELLKGTAVALGAGALGAPGCATTAGSAAPPRPAPHELARTLDPATAERVLESLDRRMAWIDRQRAMPDDLIPVSRLEGRPGFEQRERQCRRLVQKTTRSLYLTGRFADLPDELKMYPPIQHRVAGTQRDLDDAVVEMTDLLDRMSDRDHQGVQRYLRDDRRFGERLAMYLDRPAKEDGLPFTRRFGLRSSILQLCDRMAAQSPALVTDPVVRKVRRMQARPDLHAEQTRLIAARMGEDAFWAHQQKLADLHEAWQLRLGTQSQPGLFAQATPPASPAPSEAGPAPAPPGPGGGAPESPAPRREPPLGYRAQAGRTDAPERPPPPEESGEGGERPGESTVETGGVIMGFGAGSVLLGGIFYLLGSATGASGFSGLYVPAVVLGITVGPILLTVGLIVVLVGLGIEAAA